MDSVMGVPTDRERLNPRGPEPAGARGRDEGCVRGSLVRITTARRELPTIT
jgi:hypothetical protein